MLQAKRKLFISTIFSRNRVNIVFHVKPWYQTSYYEKIFTNMRNTLAKYTKARSRLSNIIYSLFKASLEASSSLSFDRYENEGYNSFFTKLTRTWKYRERIKSGLINRRFVFEKIREILWIAYAQETVRIL